jgi:site-specific DNA-adenine methylase
MPTRAATVASPTPLSSAPEAGPFLKWVGGKGKLRHALSALLPPGVERMRHVEPFMGGAAFFFARAPERALLCDVNNDLVQTYLTVRDHANELVRELSKLAKDHGKDRYYAVRERYNERPASAGRKPNVERAATRCTPRAHASSTRTSAARPSSSS